MYTTKLDFNSTKPNPRIAELTNVSDGTLSKICKESALFEVQGVNVGLNQYDKLDDIRTAWKLFTTFQLENGANVPNWVECWDQFTTYIAEQANKLFHNAISHIEGITSPTTNEVEVGGYRTYGTSSGELQLYYNGVITRHDGLNTHAVIAMLNGKDGLKKLLC